MKGNHKCGFSLFPRGIMRSPNGSNTRDKDRREKLDLRDFI